MASAKVGTTLSTSRQLSQLRQFSSAPRALNLPRFAQRHGLGIDRRQGFGTHGWVCAAVQDHVEPAVLPGTRKDFAIPAEELIELTKKYSSNSARAVGADDESILADEFRFEFPLVKLDKKSYLEAVRSFDFLGGVPNISSNTYDFRVDKYEPQRSVDNSTWGSLTNLLTMSQSTSPMISMPYAPQKDRVWYTVRVSGTHTGTLKVFKSEIKPTGRKVLGAPECMSMTFNADGKITSLTGGYVMDNRLGTCNKLGGLFGILQSMGVFVPHPQSGTLGWKVGSAVDTGVHFLTKVLSFVTFGLVKDKPKLA